MKVSNGRFVVVCGSTPKHVLRRNRLVTFAMVRRVAGAGVGGSAPRPHTDNHVTPICCSVVDQRCIVCDLSTRCAPYARLDRNNSRSRQTGPVRIEPLLFPHKPGESLPRSRHAPDTTPSTAGCAFLPSGRDGKRCNRRRVNGYKPFHSRRPS